MGVFRQFQLEPIQYKRARFHRRRETASGGTLARWAQYNFRHRGRSRSGHPTLRRPLTSLAAVAPLT
jgi:hypothetical protein